MHLIRSKTYTNLDILMANLRRCHKVLSEKAKLVYTEYLFLKEDLLTDLMVLRTL